MKYSVVLALLFCSFSYGQQVMLDPTFGNKGIVRTNVRDLNENDEQRPIVAMQPDGKIIIAFMSSGAPIVARLNSNGSRDYTFTTPVLNKFVLNDMLRQPDGKIVVAGTIYNAASTSYDFAIARLNADGSLDASFDEDGKVITDMGSVNARIYSIALQSDGKIVAAGYYGSLNDAEINLSGLSQFALARYNTNGSLDNTFSGDGKQFTDFIGDRAEIYDIKLQSDGKIVAAGLAGSSGSSPVTSFAIARYATDGTLDNTFSGDGMHTIPVGTTGKSIARGLTIQADGKILLAGSAMNGSGNSDMALIRIDDVGDIDPGFNGGEAILTDRAGSSDYGYDVVLQADGKIIVAGNANIILPGGPDSDYFIARFNDDGTPDVSFDGDGRLTTVVVNNDFITSVILQADGKIIAAGYSSMGTGTDITMARYDVTGALDTQFDDDGLLSLFVPASTDEVKAMALQPDGKIIVVGTYGNLNFLSAALVRYNPTGEVDPSFGTNGRVMLGVGGVTEVFNAVAVQPDGRIVVAGSNNSDFTIWCFESDGDPDPAFGVGGMATIPVTASSDVANAITIQGDGKIVVAGYAVVGTDLQFAVVRVSATGVPDNGFGTNGVYVSPFVPGHIRAEANAVALQADGKIVVSGYTSSTLSGSADFALARLTSGGLPDATFDSDGLLTISVGTTRNEFTAVMIQPDGKIIGTGYTGGGGSIILMRFNSEGQPDNDFGTAGILTTNFVMPTGLSFAGYLQSDEKILVAGITGNTTATGEYAFARYNADGTPDNTFGSNGQLYLTFWENFDETDIKEQVTAIQLIDNRIYAAGTSLADFILIALQNNIALPLQWLDINASWQNKDVWLYWTTEHEEGTSNFEIERSINGSDFNKIGSIAAANSPGRQTYHFTDVGADQLKTTRIYYRLKQTDIDGRFTFSPVVSVIVAAQASPAIVYPNPARDHIIISASARTTQQIKWRIIDAQGRVMRSGQRQFSAGNNSFMVNINMLARGIYYVELEYNSESQRLKLIRQ